MENYEIREYERYASSINNHKNWWLYESVANRHNLNINERIVLLFCYSEAFKKYGKIVATNDCEITIKTDDMGIRFTEDLDLKYFENLHLLLEEYEIKYFDFPYFNNLAVDLDQIKKIYPNLTNDSIRAISMYSSSKRNRDILLSISNDIEQEKIIKIITPISNDLVIDDYKDYEYDLFKFELKNRNYEFTKKKLDYLFKVMSSKKCKKISTNNYYFITQFEYLFQDILVSSKDKLNDKAIDILLKIKEYALMNIPKAEGEIIEIPKYKEESYDVYDDDANRENACYSSHTEYEKVYIGSHIISTVDYYKRDILNYKKAISFIFPMLLEDNIDYYKLMCCDCSEYIIGLIDYVKEKGKVKKNEYR